MTDEQRDIGEILEDALRESPELVANLVNRLGLVNELVDVAAMALEGADEHVVRSVSDRVAILAEAADELATSETPELASAVGTNAGEFTEAAETLARLQRSGTLDNLSDLADAVMMLNEAADDHVVRSVAAKSALLAESADALATEDTPALATGIGSNAAEFTEAVNNLARLQKTGTLDQLVDVADAVMMLNEAADDHVVQSIAKKSATLVEAADGLATTDTPGLASTIGANAAEFNAAAEKLVRLEQTGTLDQLVDLADAVMMLNEAADDHVVQSVSNRAATLAEAADALATAKTPELAKAVGSNAEQFASAAEKLARLEDTGTLDQLVDLADAVMMLNEAADDYVVRSVASAASSWGELLTTMSNRDIMCNLDTLMSSIGKSCPSTGEPERVSTIGALGKMRDPDVQRGMGFLFSIMENIGKDIRVRSEKLKRAED